MSNKTFYPNNSIILTISIIYYLIITLKHSIKQIFSLVHVLTIFIKSGNFISTCTNDDVKFLHYVGVRSLKI